MTATPDNASDLWRYWFDLKAKARTGNWDGVLKQLADTPDVQITAHPFVTEVFHTAATQGKTDVIAALFTRGLRLDAETLAETVTRLAKSNPEKTSGVLAHLIRVQHADANDAVCHVASKGRLDAMRVLEGAGANVLAGSSAFFLALYGGHPAMMSYLYEKGANLYHPNMIAAHYGRAGELPESNRRIAQQVHRDLVDMDNESWAECYRESGGKADSMESFRYVPNALGRAPVSRLQLAVRADCFADVAAVALAEKENPLTAADFLQTDHKGVCPLDILAVRGQLAQVFDVRLWHDRPAEAETLRHALKTYRAEKVIDPHTFSAAVTHFRLRQARPAAGRFTLKRRAP